MEKREDHHDRIRHLVKAEILKEGEKILLIIPEFEPGDSRFVATVTGKTGQSDALVWDFDGKEYALYPLTENILRNLNTGFTSKGINSVVGRWINKEGKSLIQLADQGR